MAELRIQPKKSAPSPWLLVALALLLLAGAAYFFLRSDPADEPAPAKTEAGPALVPADSLAPSRNDPDPTPPAADSASPASAPATGVRAQLLQLRAPLAQLADRADLREDALVREQRDNFTSATDRLASGDPQASLRPGLLAAANLLLAVQQKGYPNLEAEAASLQQQASQLSGRDATAAEQAQNQAYLGKVAGLLKAVSAPSTSQL